MSVSANASSEFILACLRHRELQSWRKTKLMAVLAVPGILIDSLFLSGIVYLLGSFVVFQFRLLEHPMAWWACFLFCIPLSIPLFWLIDRYTYPADIMESAMADPPQMLSLGFNAVSSTGSAGRGMPILTGFLLMGPRQLRKVVNRVQGARMFNGNTRDRAELALRQMLKVDHSVGVHTLLQKSEQISDLLPVMGYLLFYDWIGTSHDTLHVWLAGDSRTLLQRAPNQLVAKFN